MKRRLARKLLPAALLALASLGAAASAVPIALTDFRLLVHFGLPQFSPDGTRIAFLTARSDFVNDRYDATLRVMATAAASRARW